MSDPLNIMVEARNEYMGQLCLIMCPPMIEVFQDMYDEATKISKGRKTLIMFQKLLKEKYYKILMLELFVMEQLFLMEKTYHSFLNPDFLFRNSQLTIFAQAHP